jgi:hypothetical protein
LHSIISTNLSCILQTVSCVGGSAINSHLYCLCNHTQSLISSTTSKLTHVAWMSSEPLTFCITLWIVGKVFWILIMTDTLCYVHASSVLRGTSNFVSRMNTWNGYSLLKCIYIFLRHMYMKVLWHCSVLLNIIFLHTILYLFCNK